MNAYELEKIKSDSFDKWFERWWKKSNLTEKFKQSAMKGYSGFTIKFCDDDYLNRRMRDPRFVELLKDKMSGITIAYEQEHVTYRNLLGQKHTKLVESINFYWGKENES